MPYRGANRRRFSLVSARGNLVPVALPVYASGVAELMSRRAYARHRRCDPGAVRYAIRRGWIIPASDGRIDPKQADAGWPLERRHGPMAWIMGPEPTPPGDPRITDALDRGDYAALTVNR